MTQIKFSNATEIKATPSDQLDIIIALLKDINHRMNPPWWKILIRFIFAHLFSIISLAALAYFTWKIWGVVNGIESNINEIYTFITSNIDKLKFWN